MKDSITLDDFREALDRADCKAPFTPEALDVLVEHIGYASHDELLAMKNHAYKQQENTELSSYDRWVYRAIRHALERLT